MTVVTGAQPSVSPEHPGERAAGGLTLRLGTRRSRLALTQSCGIADRLRANGHAVEIVEIVTEGDTNGAPLTQIGGTGVFASAIRRALTQGRIDVAVHSLKDLPVAAEPGLVIAAVPEREEARDALVSAGALVLAELPAGAVVGTGSPRRAAQLRRRRPDLVVRDIRGNVDSRLRRVHDGDVDAVVLAGAGLARLGLQDQITEVLETDVMLPAPGQGALGVECRSDAPEVIAALSDLDDAVTRACVTAERAMLGALEAGCTAPIGALARVETDGSLSLRGFVGQRHGPLSFTATDSGSPADPGALGRTLARRLLRDGAAALKPATAHRDESAPVLAPSSGTAPAPTARDQFDQE